MGRALLAAKTQLFSGRTTRGRKRTLLVIADGVSSDSVKQPAMSLKRNDVQIFTLGVGSGFRRSQLQIIATSPADVFTAGFGRLGTLVKVIKEKICLPSIPTPTRKYFPCRRQFRFELIHGRQKLFLAIYGEEYLLHLYFLSKMLRTGTIRKYSRDTALFAHTFEKLQHASHITPKKHFHNRRRFIIHEKKNS